MHRTLEAVAGAVVERDPAQWKGYGLPPLPLIDSPGAPFAGMFSAEIDLHLDFVMEAQDPDGSWKPTWSWGDAAPQAGEEARREWTGASRSARQRPF